MLRGQFGTPERAEYDTVAPRQRRRWLLARLAAKDAVRRLMWDGGAGPIFPAELEIRHAHDRGPASGLLTVVGRHGRQVPDLRIAVGVAGVTAVAIARPADRPAPGIAITEYRAGSDRSIAEELALAAAMSTVDPVVSEAPARVLATEGSLWAVRVPEGSGPGRTRQVRTAVLDQAEGLDGGPWLVAWT
ncbi:hypothetical protein [Actinoalloteichus hymeniacidonis]|uniref:Uncharacterized protein n=1 Tax=Actinoalloteichus hymeniacidonis TaxID=340345 RepID=A0AAC9HRE6_9PSEU|nr:hypothetical protein [Actinoalloteichus hymeniacidonis]AOS64234.1 hypothetical protein TL08_17170 [Actinoalloteichus hymeniacidonis]MBB5907698.1 hypothetical protein [Actinoalloteichus hymeniacidonis]